MASRPLNTATLLHPGLRPSARGLVLHLVVMLRAFRTRRELARLEPRMLRDIGVSAGEAAREAGRAPWDLR